MVHTTFLYFRHNMKGKNMDNYKKTAVALTVITLMCKCFGFVREMILAYFFGTTYVVDAFLMASIIPEVLFCWLGTIVIAYTPKFTEIKHRLGEDEAQKYTYNIMGLLLMLSSICAFFTLVFSNQIVAFAAPGFTGDIFYLTRDFLMFSVFSIMFVYISRIMISYLDCNGKFLKSRMSNLVVSSSQIIVIFAAGMLGSLEILIFSVIVAAIAQFVVVGVFASMERLHFKVSFKFDEHIKSTLKFVLPIFISSMIMQINTFVDKSFASRLAEGSIAALNYADKIKLFIVAIFSIAIVTIIYPVLSKAVSEKKMDEVKALFTKSLNIILVLFIPITFGAILLARPAMTVVYMRGAFDSNSLDMTVIAFIMYAIGVMFIALSDVLTRVFYSLQDAKSALIVGAITVSINIGLNFVLVDILGHAGLALSTSIAAICSIPLYLFFLRRRIGNLGLTNSGILAIKSLFSASVMAVVVYLINTYISSIDTGVIYSLISIVISGIVGATIYYVLMLLLKVEEVKFAGDLIRRKIKK